MKMSTDFSENVFMKILLNIHDSLLVGLLYRSPLNQNEDFDNNLRDLTSEAANKGDSHLFLMEDFNYSSID